MRDNDTADSQGQLRHGLLPARRDISDLPKHVAAKALREDLLLRPTIHVWRVNLARDLQSECAAEYSNLLSMQERSRAAAFLRQEPRLIYVGGRSVLRRLLGFYLHQNPADIVIETSGFGKPFLAAPSDSRLCFNVSHSETTLLVAFAYNRRLGVDIERVRVDLDLVSLIENYFAAEERPALVKLSALDRVAAFFCHWTRKEAYLKATGYGLLTPLQSFVVSSGRVDQSADFKATGKSMEMTNWALYDVPVAGHAAAVAAEGDIFALRTLDYATIFYALILDAYCIGTRHPW